MNKELKEKKISYRDLGYDEFGRRALQPDKRLAFDEFDAFYEIPAGSIRSSKLTLETLEGLNEILDGSIGEEKIKDLAISAQKLADQAVTEDKYAPQSIVAAAIGLAAINSVHIQNGAITDAKILNLDAGKITAGYFEGRELRSIIPSGSAQREVRIAGPSANFAETSTFGSTTYASIGLEPAGAHYQGLFIDAVNDLTLTSGEELGLEYNQDGEGDEIKMINAVTDTLRARLDTGGTMHATGFSSGTADFAEYFENKTKKEIPVGTPVSIENGKIVLANEDSPIIGVISNTASLVGNTGSADTNEWGGKYLTDEDDNRVQYDRILITYTLWSGESGDRKKEKYRTFEDENEEIPEDAKNIKRRKVMCDKINPKYNPRKKYKHRSQRPKEWSLVGLKGQVKVLKGSIVNPSWIKMGKKNSKYDMYLLN